jgi:steroid delta-isomerase-like uncharacterized protein
MPEARDLAELHIRSFDERTWSRAPQIYAPDIVSVQPGGTTIEGIDALVGFGQGFATAFPDSRHEVRSILESGNIAVAEVTYIGTHTGPMASPQGEVPATGRTLRLPACLVFEVNAGRITAQRAYFDQMTLAAQLGLIPDAAAAS